MWVQAERSLFEQVVSLTVRRLFTPSVPHLRRCLTSLRRGAFFFLTSLTVENRRSERSFLFFLSLRTFLSDSLTHHSVSQSVSAGLSSSSPSSPRPCLSLSSPPGVVFLPPSEPRPHREGMRGRGHRDGPRPPRARATTTTSRGLKGAGVTAALPWRPPQRCRGDVTSESYGFEREQQTCVNQSVAVLIRALSHRDNYGYYNGESNMKASLSD